MHHKYHVYILVSYKDGKNYIGHTNNLKDRLKRHNEGREKSTKNRKPFKLLYNWIFQNKSDAIIFEKYLKRLKSPDYINKLIDKGKAGL